MRTLRQIAAVTGMNLRSIPQRVGSSVVIVVGIAGVVGVLVSVFTMATSLSGTVLSTGRPDRAIVLRSGTNSEAASSLSVDAVQTIMNAPGIARTPGGDPAASGDVVVAVNMHRKKDGSLAPLTVRGVSPQDFFVRPEIKLVEGRMFKPGLREVIVGRSGQREDAGLALGDKVSLRNSQWTVVGVYTSGDSYESGMLTDSKTLQSAYQRTFVNAVTALLASPGSFDAFKKALTTNPTLSVEVLREPEYYAQQSKNISNLMFFVTYVVGAIMAVGALFAALNTMYAAVSARAIEIATLRSIGFGAAPVAVSVLAEALLLALIGAAIGATIAWVLFSGNTISLGGTLGSVVTQLKITPTLLGIGALWACGVGLLGGLFPAIRAARLPVATALRAI